MSEQEKNVRMALIFKWTARVFSLPAILFVLAHLFGSESGQGVEESWLGWTTLIVMFISVGSLAFAWWKERVGGWAAIAALVVFILLFWIDRGVFFPLPMIWLFLLGIALPAGLFILSYSFKKDAV